MKFSIYIEIQMIFRVPKNVIRQKILRQTPYTFMRGFGSSLRNTGFTLLAF